jgi:transposase-like protein
MTDSEFALLRASQYCDNPSCKCYQLVGADNLRVQSRKHNQLYCNECNNKFSATRGTMFYCLHTPMDRIVNSLGLLASGMGVNAITRETGVTADSLRSWIQLASEQTEAFSVYMQQNMSLGQVQIDEFWSFIRKKKKI